MGKMLKTRVVSVASRCKKCTKVEISRYLRRQKKLRPRNVENVSRDVIVYHFLVEIGIFASTYFEKYYLCIAYIRNISKIDEIGIF